MRQRLPLVLSATALIVAVLGSTAPAIAHGVQHALFAHNADKVDGKHAVPANATLSAAAGKLVATKAVGADKGRFSANFIPTIAPSKLGSFPAARVFRSTPQTVGAANTILSFDSERFDTANLHSSANPARLRAPLAGVYFITANVNWELPDGTPIWLGLRRNGGLTGDAFIAAEAETAQVSDEQALSTIYKLAAGDFIDVVVHQGSGADATVGPGDNRASFAMTWLGRG